VRPSALILELKHWDTRNDLPGAGEGLMQHGGRLVLHPAEQLCGYVEYCRRFHSAIDDEGAAVDGCVVFTARPLNPAYFSHPNETISRRFPSFAIPAESEGTEFIDFVSERIFSSGS